MFCGFDRATSKGDGKEDSEARSRSHTGRAASCEVSRQEFVLKVLPVFVFRSIPRNSVNDLLVNGHFEDGGFASSFMFCLRTCLDASQTAGAPGSLRLHSCLDRTSLACFSLPLSTTQQQFVECHLCLAWFVLQCN